MDQVTLSPPYPPQVVLNLTPGKVIVTPFCFILYLIICSCCMQFLILWNTVQLRDILTLGTHSEHIPNSFEMHLYWSANTFTNAITSYGTFVECVCFCLNFLCFIVFYPLHETKRELHSTLWRSWYWTLTNWSLLLI